MIHVYISAPNGCRTPAHHSKEIQTRPTRGNFGLDDESVRLLRTYDAYLVVCPAIS